jgi:hypothetical protein
MYGMTLFQKVLKFGLERMGDSRKTISQKLCMTFLVELSFLAINYSLEIIVLSSQSSRIYVHGM